MHCNVLFVQKPQIIEIRLVNLKKRKERQCGFLYISKANLDQPNTRKIHLFPHTAYTPLSLKKKKKHTHTQKCVHPPRHGYFDLKTCLSDLVLKIPALPARTLVKVGDQVNPALLLAYQGTA